MAAAKLWGLARMQMSLGSNWLLQLQQRKTSLLGAENKQDVQLQSLPVARKCPPHISHSECFWFSPVTTSITITITITINISNGRKCDSFIVLESLPKTFCYLLLVVTLLHLVKHLPSPDCAPIEEIIRHNNFC